MEEGIVRADNTLCLFIASGRQLPLPHKILISIFTDGLTDRIKEVLDTPEGEVDIEPAALLLPKLNRNRILYESIPRRENVDKLKYGLRKIHTFRSREESAKETEALEKEAVNIIKKTFPKEEKRQAPQSKGMRPDHDLLPEEIKAMYPENLNVYPEMRKLHGQLKLLNTALACDRYPFLKELKTPDEKLRKNRAAYDSFTAAPSGSDPAGNAGPGNAPAGEDETAGTLQNGGTSPENQETAGNAGPSNAPSGAAGNAGLQNQALEVVKKIPAARKYLSDSKVRLAGLKAQEDQSNYRRLPDKMQKRLALPVASNAGISDEYRAELKNPGLNVQ